MKGGEGRAEDVLEGGDGLYGFGVEREPDFDWGQRCIR